MAEELDIRSVWKKSKEKTKVSADGISLLKTGKRTTLSWIKIILTIEFWLSIVSIPFVLHYFNSTGESTWITIFYLLVTLVYLFYYQFLIKKIREFRYDGNVLVNLTKVYGYLRFYLLHYKVVIWLSLILGFIYGFFAEENQEAMQKVDSTKDWLIILAITGTFLLIIGLVIQWCIHMIYGRKIKRLKKVINDLQET